MRRRRRSQGTWLPTIGNAVGQEASENDITGIDSDFDVEDNCILSTRLFPITLDQPQEEVTSETPLVSVVGSEYFLKRIVGKCFIEANQQAGGDATFDQVLVGAGFFISRVESDDADFPIGSASGTNAEVNKDYSPLETRTQREPWIWRRTWIIGTGNQATPPGTWPLTTSNYGSIQDGPHIDAKTKRRIGNDDRLWFAISAVRWPLFATGASPSGNPVVCRFHVDYRLFGQLRRPKNRGVF